MGENLFSHAMSAANFAKSKHEVYFNVFHSERKYIGSLLQITNKRARKLSKRMGEKLFSHVMSAANFAKSKHEVYFTYFMSVT